MASLGSISKGLQQYTVQEAQNAGLGQAGYKYIDQSGTDNTGAASAGVYYVAVTVLESASDTTAAIATVSDDQSLFPNTTFASLPSGTTLYGRWNQVTISGAAATAIAYRG